MAHPSHLRGALRSGTRLAVLSALLILPGPSGASWAASFTVTGTKDIPLKGQAINTAVSPDGRFTFVLLAGGNIEVLDAAGVSVQTLQVGGDYNNISIGPTGTVLILSGGRQAKVTLVSLDPIVEIDAKGSPTLGSPTAPVTIAVYTDFQ